MRLCYYRVNFDSPSKNIQVQLKKFEYREKGQYSSSVISESENWIYSRLITHN